MMMKNRIRAVMLGTFACLVFAPAIAQAHTANVQIDCSGAHVAFNSFPRGDNNARVQIASDSRSVADQTVVWRGSSYTAVVPFSTGDDASHSVSAQVTWSADGGGHQSGYKRLTCNHAPPPPPPVIPPTPPAPTPPTIITQRYGCDGALIADGASPPTCPGATVFVPIPCPKCAVPKTVCKQCVSRRILTIRIIEHKGHRLRKVTGTMRGRHFTATRTTNAPFNVTGSGPQATTGRVKAGRLVMRLDFRGFTGPDVLVLKLRGVRSNGKIVHGVRFYRVCKPNDHVHVNFDDTLTL